MFAPIMAAGQYGIVKDLPPYEIPFNAWTDASNVLFRRGYAHRAVGYGEIHTPAVPPYFVDVVLTPSQTYYLLAGMAKAYAWHRNSDAEITRASGDYTGTERDAWVGSLFNGVYVLTNGVDAPQVWNPVGLGTALVDLPNWPSGYTARVIKPFKNFLVALGVTKPGLDDPRYILWSNAADPGIVPDSWDVADATKLAGDVSLSGGSDRLVDIVPLAGYGVVYGELSSWLMQYVGYPDVFWFRKLFATAGAINVGCAQPFHQRHFVVTMDDVIVHNGGEPQSVIDKALRGWFFSNLNTGALGAIRVLRFDYLHEMWILFPYGNTTVCNMALVWNWMENTWAVRDLPNVGGGFGLSLTVDSGATWDDWASTAWDALTDAWGTPSLARSRVAQVVLWSGQNSAVYQTDDSKLAAGEVMDCWLEKRDLDIAVGQDGSVSHDNTSVKLVRGIWPMIDAPAGTKFTIQLAGYDFPGGFTAYSTSGDFVVGTSPKLDLTARGRYLAIKISQQGSEDWTLFGYVLDMTPLGALQ